MRTNKITSRLILSLLCTSAISVTAIAETPALPKALMCTPGELIFSEDFDPETVSDRWGFKADFALRDGALLRTKVNPAEGKRVFLKDPSFHNTIIQFDFKCSGQTTDLRLVTGSGGHYNSVTQIHRGHFQLNTPVDRDAGIVPAQLGECVRKPRPDQWQTMTVEYWDDEVVAHTGDNEFVVARHPIIDRTRQYFAFQFDLPGASIDNVRVWKATGQRNDWTGARERLAVIQAKRAPVKRDPTERYKLAYTNLKSRLTLHDQAYRDLVAKHDKLQARSPCELRGSLHHPQATRQTHRAEKTTPQGHGTRIQDVGDCGPQSIPSRGRLRPLYQARTRQTQGRWGTEAAVHL